MFCCFGSRPKQPNSITVVSNGSVTPHSGPLVNGAKKGPSSVNSKSRSPSWKLWKSSRSRGSRRESGLTTASYARAAAVYARCKIAKVGHTDYPPLPGDNRTSSSSCGNSAHLAGPLDGCLYATVSKPSSSSSASGKKHHQQITFADGDSSGDDVCPTSGWPQATSADSGIYSTCASTPRADQSPGQEYVQVGSDGHSPQPAAVTPISIEVEVHPEPGAPASESSGSDSSPKSDKQGDTDRRDQNRSESDERALSRLEQEELDELLSNCLKELECFGDATMTRGNNTCSSRTSGPAAHDDQRVTRGQSGGNVKVGGPSSVSTVDPRLRCDSGLTGAHDYQTLSRAISPSGSELGSLQKSPSFSYYQEHRPCPNGPSREPIYGRAMSDIVPYNYASNGFVSKHAKTPAATAPDKLDEMVLSLLKEVESIPDYDTIKFNRSYSFRPQSVSAVSRPRCPVRSSSYTAFRSTYTSTPTRAFVRRPSNCSDMSNGPTNVWSFQQWTAECSKVDYPPRGGPDCSNMSTFSDASSSYQDSVFDETSISGLKNLSWLQRQQIKLKHKKEIEERTMEQRLLDELRGSFRTFKPRELLSHRQQPFSNGYATRPGDLSWSPSYRTPLYVQTGPAMYGRKRQASEPNTPSMARPHSRNQVTPGASTLTSRSANYRLAS